MTGSNRRQYFTESKLNKLISAARKGRYGHRDVTLTLDHGRGLPLRVSEAVDLEWSSRSTSIAPTSTSDA